MRVAAIIVGVGHMGLRALLLTNWLRDYMQRTHGIEYQLIALADPIEKARSIAEAVADGLQATPRMFETLTEGDRPSLLSWLWDTGYFDRRSRESTKLLLYDASNADAHFGHLVTVHRLGIHYLGEKPIVLSPYHQPVLDSQQARYWCDFIELQSLTYHALRRFIQHQKFKVREARFWRLGSTALKKLADPDARKGVQGGALEDKAPHDFALTLSLLSGVGSVDGVRVVGAKAGSYVPASLEHLREGRPELMDHRGKSITALKRMIINPPGEYGDPYYAADAEMRVETSWTLRNGESVPVYYGFSWIGVGSFFDEIRSALGGTNILDGDWFGHTMETRRGISYPVQEARLAIVRGECEGRELTLVANFLVDAGKDFGNERLVPWVRVVDGGRCSLVEVPLIEFGTNSLARIIRDVILDLTGQQRAAHLNESAARLVTNALISAREASLPGLLDEAALQHAAVEVFAADRGRFLGFFQQT